MRNTAAVYIQRAKTFTYPLDMHENRSHRRIATLKTSAEDRDTPRIKMPAFRFAIRRFIYGNRLEISNINKPTHKRTYCIVRHYRSIDTLFHDMYDIRLMLFVFQSQQ
jgi:hypothetical protein